MPLRRCRGTGLLENFNNAVDRPYERAKGKHSFGERLIGTGMRPSAHLTGFDRIIKFAVSTSSRAPVAAQCLGQQVLRYLCVFVQEDQVAFAHLIRMDAGQHDCVAVECQFGTTIDLADGR
jgi:hypothetical protein